MDNCFTHSAEQYAQLCQ